MIDLIKKATMIGSDVEPLKKSAVTPARFLFKNGSLSPSLSQSQHNNGLSVELNMLVHYPM